MMNGTGQHYDVENASPMAWVVIGLLAGLQTVGMVGYGYYSGNAGYIHLSGITLAFSIIFISTGIWEHVNGDVGEKT